MPVPTQITDLSTTAASNSPAGTDSVLPNLDDYLRAHASFIAQLNAQKQAALGYTPANKAGDTMTGFLTLNAAPTSNLHAATKKYVDDAAALLATKADPTFTGQASFATGSNAAPSISFSGDPDTGIYSGAANTLNFAISGSPRAVIPAGGGFWIGSGNSTSETIGTIGVHVPDGNSALLRLYQAGRDEWWAGMRANNVSLDVGRGAGTSSVLYSFSPTNFVSQPDNSKTLGVGSSRWSTVYAATGAINTSDAREKTVVTPLTVAEIEAAKALAREIGTYQWLASIEQKGEAARLHVGLTVQRAIEVMKSFGLDPMRYGFICYDEWTPEGGGAKQDRYSFRMDELLLFLARGFDARLSALEG